MLFLIALLSPFFYAASVVIESFLSLAVFKRPIVMLFFVSLTNALFTPLVLLFGTPSIPSAEAFYIYIIIAFIDIAYLYPYYVALKKTDTSIISSLFALGNIFVPVLSFILLSEVLALHQYIGFSIIILASVILNKKRQIKFCINKAFYLMVLSTFLLASKICLAKYVLNLDHNVANVLIYPNLLSGLIPWLFLFSSHNKKDIKKKFKIYHRQFKFFVIIELLTFGAVATSMIALDKLSPTVSAAIGALEPLFVLGIITLIQPYSNFHFKDHGISLKKTICFLCIIIGVVMTCTK